MTASCNVLTIWNQNENLSSNKRSQARRSIIFPFTYDDSLNKFYRKDFDHRSKGLMEGLS